MRGAHLVAAAALCLAPGAWAQEQTEQSADRFTNADLLAQTERDRRLWISAVMVGTSTAAGLHDVETGRCLARWYFDNEAERYAEILGGLHDYPDNRPVEVIYALAQRACPGLIPTKP